MLEPWITASGFTVLTRIPSGPPSSARHRARCSEAALADEYAAALAPATSAFFDATKTIDPPDTLRLEDAERLARGEEVPACEDREVALPVLERGLRHGSARREPRGCDEDVEPAVREHGATGHLLHGVLERHVHLDGESATGSVGRLDLVRDLLRSICMQIPDDDVRSERGELPCRRAPDAAPAARDHRDAACELPAWGRLRELVALERPVLDRERLRFRERAEPAERLGRVLDGDRPVIEVARQACARGIAHRS